MITFKFDFTDKEIANSFKQRFHESLVGSPAYINSEIAICDGDYEDEFYLVAGNDNKEDNIQINIHADDSFTVDSAKFNGTIDIMSQMELD